MKATLNGITLKIEQDELAQSPREWDNLGTMVCWHNRYNLGDKHTFEDSHDFLSELAWSLDGGSTYEWEELQDMSDSELLAFVRSLKTMILPVYMYDHGDVSLSVEPYSCRWDSGQVGWVYATHDKLVKEYQQYFRKGGKKKLKRSDYERAERCLKAEVETYGQYVNGEVYWFGIEDENGELIDSCGGFFGYDPKKNGMMEHINEKYHALVDMLE